MSIRIVAIAAPLISLTLMACDPQRVKELEEGVSSETDVRARFGTPENVWEGPMASTSWNTTASPPGTRTT